MDPGDVLRGLDIDPTTATVVDLPHNAGLTPGIWRVETPDGVRVVKCLRAHREASGSAWLSHWRARPHDIEHWSYWAREGLAYEDGLVDAFNDGGIAAPTLVAIRHVDDAIDLVLDMVEGTAAEQWSINDYGDVAHRLGVAQGQYLTGRPMPTLPWLTRRYLREYSSEKPVAWHLLDDDDAWAQPLVRDHFPAELRPAATTLHENRERLYRLAEQVPRTLCHLDFWTKNLIRRADGTIVLLDWAFVGDGAIGEDPGNLIPDAAFDHFVPAEPLPELEEVVTDSYLRGLVESGWAGDPRIGRLGVLASAVKYDWLTPAMLETAGAPRQMRYGGSEEIDAGYRFQQRGLALLHNARNAAKALTLADEVGWS